MGASTNTGLDLGGTGWVPFDAGVPEPMYVYFRTSGSIRYSINPNVVPGFCDILCVFKTPPYFPGEVGGAGIPGTGWLRYRVRVNGAEAIGYPLPDGQMEFLAFVSPGDSIFVQRTGVDGVVTCLTLLVCAGYREGWYSLTDQGLRIDAYKVLPLQVQPEMDVAVPGDSVTFHVTTFDPNVSRWSWLWRHANGASGPGFSECTGRPVCRVPVTDGGTMIVHDARWRVTQPLRQAVSAPVTVQPLRFTVACDREVERTARVRCTAEFRPPLAYTVVRRQARGRGLSIDSAPNTAHPAGTVYEWSGPALLDTEVRITAEAEVSGQRREFTESARFAVKPRAWDPIQLAGPPELFVRVHPPMTQYPGPDTARVVLGFFTLEDLGATNTRSAVAETGPNAGARYLTERPGPYPPGSLVAMHPALYPPADGNAWTNPTHRQWYEDQNGRPRGTCDANGVARYRAEAERHEGLTQANDSHWGVAQKALRELKPHERFEEYVRFGVDELAFSDSIRDVWLRWRASREYRERQAAFDSADYPKVKNRAGCRLDFDPTDP